MLTSAIITEKIKINHHRPLCISRNQVTVLCHARSVLAPSTACEQDCCCFFSPSGQIVCCLLRLSPPEFHTGWRVYVALYNAAQCTRLDEQSSWLRAALLGAVGGSLEAREVERWKRRLMRWATYPCYQGTGQQSGAPPPPPSHHSHLNMCILHWEWRVTVWLISEGKDTMCLLFFFLYEPKCALSCPPPPSYPTA